MISIRWYGRGGQGAFTAARLLGQTVSVYGGSYALASPFFGPERRGAPVWSFTKIDGRKIVDRSQPVACDYLVGLDETLVKEDIARFIKEDGVLILNTAKPEKYAFVKRRTVTLDATKMALNILGRPITNVVMLGAFAGVSGLFPVEDAEKSLQRAFSKALYEKNRQLLREAYEAVKGGESHA